jgi:hypothetical protein
VCGGVREIGPFFFRILETEIKIVYLRYKFKKSTHMKMSQYQSLRSIPSQCELLAKQINPNPRELVITVVSCMCDNEHVLKLKKNEEGDFKIDTCGQAYSNFSFEFRKDEIEWAADEGDFYTVFKMINSGTSVISEVKSR